MTREQVLKKISKLLALAGCQSGNLNETSVAAEKAAQLMAEYNIARFEVKTVDEALKEEPLISREIYSCGRLTSWRVTLLSRLAKANNCAAYVTPGRGMSVVGQDSDIQTTKYLFDLYCNKVDELCTAWGGRGRRACNAFRVGAASAIGERIEAAKKKTEETAKQRSSTALMRMDQLQQKATAEVARICRGGRPWRAGRVNKDGYEAGRRAGYRADLGGSRGALGAAPGRLKS